MTEEKQQEQRQQQRQRRRCRNSFTPLSLVTFLVITSSLLGHYTAHASTSSDDIEMTLDGSQFIEKSLLVDPTYKKTNELQIIFKTSISSGLLFYASGTTGDYVVLELVHGKLRYTANSDGLSELSKPVEIIYGTNYADGRYHQVNVEIGEFTKLYTYTYPEDQSNATVVRSTAKDLRYDLDEITYYAGLPITQRAATKGIVLSTTNFRGCLNVITFNKNPLKLSKSDLEAKDSDTVFHGDYIEGCHIEKPKFVKSFDSTSDRLEVYSHVHQNMFRTEFYYRTYLQTGNILLSRDPSKDSSLSLSLKDNKLRLYVNVTRNDSISIGHFNAHADDGVWRKIRIDVTPSRIVFGVDSTVTTYDFNETQTLKFPYKTVFGGESHQSEPGFTGCIKDVLLGNDLTSIQKITLLNLDLEYEEKMCTMKDLCLPSKPCINNGRCVQQPTKATCHCQGTGYTGNHCETKNEVYKYRESCSGYFKLGFRTNALFTIQPGTALPFTVFCDMENKDGPKTIIKTNQMRAKNNVFQSKSYDKDFYYHSINYKASKQQIASLIAVSLTCRQYVRYDCVTSSLLNTFKTERFSNLGIRWYSRKGFPRRYWHGDATTAGKQSCRCGLEGSCDSPDVLCNCDTRNGQEFRYDDGFITEKDDLPISKIRVSIQRTNHRSSFHIGNLECSDNVNASNVVPSFVPELATDINGVVMLEPTAPHSNQTDIAGHKKKTKSLVLIDTKLLYALIISVIFLIALLLLILVLKRRLCCCYYANKAKPQIVEIYKDAEMPSLQSPTHHHSNNNKNSFQLTDHDDPYNVVISGGGGGGKGSTKKGLVSSYPVSASESSMSTVDASRYYQHHHAHNSDSDTLSLHHHTSIIPPEPPVRTVLKIKKELALKQRQPSTETASPRLSSASETSVTATTNTNTNSNNNNRSKSSKLNSPPQVEYSLAKAFATNSESRDLRSEETANKNGISPLKKKILEMSTSKQRLHSGEIYFHHQASSNSTATMKSLSSSCSSSSSKESDINTTDEDLLLSNDLSELLLPKSRSQSERSKGARFTEEEKKDFYAHMYRARTNSSNNGTGGVVPTAASSKFTVADFQVRNDEYSYDKDDQSKTLV